MLQEEDSSETGSTSGSEASSHFDGVGCERRGWFGGVGGERSLVSQLAGVEPHRIMLVAAAVASVALVFTSNKQR